MRIDPEVDRRTAKFAERHYGFFTIEEAYRLGHTPDSLRTRRRNGIYEKEAPHLFRLAGTPRSWQGDAYAAVKAGPPGTLASALTVCALFGAGTPPLLPHIAVPRRSNARVIKARVHQTNVADCDRTMFGIIPITTPVRAVVDAAPLVDLPTLSEIVDVLRTSQTIRDGQLEEAIERLASGRHAQEIDNLRETLLVWAPGIEHDSVPEARLFRFVVQWGFGMPVPLYVIRDDAGRFVCETDAAWPDHKVALDYDSPRHHGPRRDAEDERRHGEAEALGWAFVSVDMLDLRPGGHARFRDELTRHFRRAA